jgi:hypothetical protein
MQRTLDVCESHLTSVSKFAIQMSIMTHIIAIRVQVRVRVEPPSCLPSKKGKTGHQKPYALLSWSI